MGQRQNTAWCWGHMRVDLKMLGMPMVLAHQEVAEKMTARQDLIKGTVSLKRKKGTFKKFPHREKYFMSVPFQLYFMERWWFLKDSSG